MSGKWWPFLRCALWLYVLLTATYLLTWPADFRTIDGEFLYRVTESFVETGTPAIACDDRYPLHSLTGRDGRCFAVYGPGQSIATLPLYLLGREAERLWEAAEHGQIRRLAVSTFNAFVTPLTAVALAGLLFFLGFSLPVATATALLYGLATLAFPYARWYFSEPLVALLSLGSFAVLVVARREPRPGLLLLAGGLLGYALLVRPTAALFVAPFSAYLVWTGWRGRDPIRRILGEALVFGLPVGAGALAVAGYNWYRFGDPLDTGFPSALFNRPVVEGVYGLLLSPGRGIVWYAPTVLLAPWGFWRLARRQLAAEAAVCAALLPLFVLAHARWHDWAGGTTWGPRFLVPAVAFWMVPLATLWRGPWARLALCLAAVVSFGVQALGVLADFGAVLRELGGAGVETYLRWETSPIVGHWRYVMAARALDVAVHRLPEHGLPAATRVVPTVLGALAVGAALRLAGGVGITRVGGRRVSRLGLVLPVLLPLAHLVMLPPGPAPLPPRVRVLSEVSPEALLSEPRRFPNGVSLLGVAVADEPRSDAALVVHLFWQAHQPEQTAVKVFVHLTSDDPAVKWAQDDALLGWARLPPHLWRPWWVVRTSHALYVPPWIPSGRYFLRAGLYRLDGRVLAPIDGQGRPVGDPTAAVLPVVVEGRPLAPKGYTVSLDAATGLPLEEAAVGWRRVRAGGSLPVALTWRTAPAIRDGLALEFHLTDEMGREFARRETSPCPEGCPSTAGPVRRWVDQHRLGVDETVPPGVYHAWLVLRPTDALVATERAGDGASRATRLSLGAVEVLPP